MNIYTPNGSIFVIASSPTHANEFYSTYLGAPEPITGLTWTQVPDNQNIEAWQQRTLTAAQWVEAVGVPAGAILA